MSKKIDYIFIKKKKEKIPTKDGIIRIELIPSIINILKNNFDSYKVSKKEETLKYVPSVNVGTFRFENTLIRFTSRTLAKYKLTYLTISCSIKSEKECVKILEKIHTIIDKESSKNYICIISNDDISEYYCNKLYNKLNKFDRLLRQLMFNVYTFVYGQEYYKKTVDSKLLKKFQSRGTKKESIEDENANILKELLYSLEYGDIEQLLFKPTWREEDILYKENILTSTKDFSKLDDKVIRKIIKNIEPKSDWSRIFEKEIKINNLNKLIGKLKEYRNSIAHCKIIHSDDYIKCNNLLDEMNNKLEQAVKITLSKDFEKENLEYSTENISKTIVKVMEPLRDISKYFVEYNKLMMAPLLEISNSFKKIAICNPFSGLNLKNMNNDSIDSEDIEE